MTMRVSIIKRPDDHDLDRIARDPNGTHALVPRATWERLWEAIGLLTTLHPTMEMDANNPLDMAKKIERHVTERIAELESCIESEEHKVWAYRKIIHYDEPEPPFHSVPLPSEVMGWPLEARRSVMAHEVTIGKLNQRIEELEKIPRGYVFISDKGEMETGHYITDAQIDVFWRMITEESWCCEDAAREAFGIVRCEGCWKCDPTIASYMNEPTCSGHGWVMEADDE